MIYLQTKLPHNDIDDMVVRSTDPGIRLAGLDPGSSTDSCLFICKAEIIIVSTFEGYGSQWINISNSVCQIKIHSATQVCLFTTLNIACRCLLSQTPAFSGPDNENTQEAAFTATTPRPNKVARQSLYMTNPRPTTSMLGLCRKRTLASQTSVAYISSLQVHNSTNEYHILDHNDAGGKP